MNVTVLYDVAWPRTLRHIPRRDLPAVLAMRDRSVVTQVLILRAVRAPDPPF